MTAQHYSQTMAFKKQALMLREEERKLAIKYADLMPEYIELVKEVQETRNKLQKAKSKRDNLIGVVRFLRQKRRTLKKISGGSKASEMGHANKSVRTWPHMDQNHDSTTLATIGKDIATIAKSQYAMKAPAQEENITTQFQSTILSPIYENQLLSKRNRYH